MNNDDPRLTKLVCTTCGHRKAALFVMRILYDREGPFCVPHGSPLYSCTGYWKDPNPWTAVPPMAPEEAQGTSGLRRPHMTRGGT